MAASSSARTCRWWLLVLLPSVAVFHAAEARDSSSLGKYCPSLDACRGGVANLRCCTAINDGINRGDCSCVCKQLKIYNHGQLVQDCNARWCIRCKTCRCAMAGDGPHSY